MNATQSREAFEEWYAKSYHPAALRPMENGCYLNSDAGMAWDGWQASRSEALAELRSQLEAAQKHLPMFAELMNEAADVLYRMTVEHQEELEVRCWLLDELRGSALIALAAYRPVIGLNKQGEE